MPSLTVAVWLHNPQEPSDHWRYCTQSPGLDMTTHGWFKVHSQELTFNTPQVEDVIPQTVKLYRDKKQAILAKAQSEANHIELLIEQMLTLGYTPAGGIKQVFDADDDFPF